uniref:(northern house mosquito) hypothetical protein n=1 Tax=Culex pipiens TaxID=7175 RepID=A0A8D8LEI4_CULPI
MMVLLMLLLMMVMTVGCTVTATADVAAIASRYRRVTLERESVGNDGVPVVTTAQINRVGVIVTAGGEAATTANYDIVVVLKASIVVVVVDYNASVASGDTAADCALIGVASGNDVMLLRRLVGQMLLQDELVGRFHRDR